MTGPRLPRFGLGFRPFTIGWTVGGRIRLPNTPGRRIRIEFLFAPLKPWMIFLMSSAKRVLLVDDDAMLRTSLAEQLAAEGSYTVVEAGDCATARRLAGDGLYEFMILDVGLPDGDGRTLCRDLRALAVTCPILLLTAADTDGDAIQGSRNRAPTIT